MPRWVTVFGRVNHPGAEWSTHIYSPEPALCGRLEWVSSRGVSRHTHTAWCTSSYPWSRSVRCMPGRPLTNISSYLHNKCTKLHRVPKNKTRVILNILYSCKSIAMKFSVWYLMTLAIKHIHNLPPHLSYVSTLPDITHKHKSYVVFLSVVWVTLKRTGFSVSEVALRRLCR